MVVSATFDEDDDIVAAIRAGAGGYLLEDTGPGEEGTNRRLRAVVCGRLETAGGCRSDRRDLGSGSPVRCPPGRYSGVIVSRMFTSALVGACSFSAPGGLVGDQDTARMKVPIMRIVVDLNRCQGYAQCVPLAPDVLELLGEEALVYDPEPDDTQRRRVLRAAAACPVQAILVETCDPEAEGPAI